MEWAGTGQRASLPTVSIRIKLLQFHTSYAKLYMRKPSRGALPKWLKGRVC